MVITYGSPSSEEREFLSRGQNSFHWVKDNGFAKQPKFECITISLWQKIFDVFQKFDFPSNITKDVAENLFPLSLLFPTLAFADFYRRNRTEIQKSQGSRHHRQTKEISTWCDQR